MRSIIFTSFAQKEVVEALDWYERESSGLGRKFGTAIEESIQRIRDNPGQFPIVRRNIRRALLNRFPYALMFIVKADETVSVIACFHGSRDPMKWRERA